jgi:hypothetical protein
VVLDFSLIGPASTVPITVIGCDFRTLILILIFRA